MSAKVPSLESDFGIMPTPPEAGTTIFWNYFSVFVPTDATDADLVDLIEAILIAAIPSENSGNATAQDTVSAEVSKSVTKPAKSSRPERGDAEAKTSLTRKSGIGEGCFERKSNLLTS